MVLLEGISPSLPFCTPKASSTLNLELKDCTFDDGDPFFPSRSNFSLPCEILHQIWGLGTLTLKIRKFPLYRFWWTHRDKPLVAANLQIISHCLFLDFSHSATPPSIFVLQRFIFCFFQTYLWSWYGFWRQGLLFPSSREAKTVLLNSAVHPWHCHCSGSKAVNRCLIWLVAVPKVSQPLE